MLDFMLQELNQIRRNGSGRFILRRVRLSLIGVVTLHNGNDLLGVNWDMRCANAILRSHDEVRLSARGKIGHGDIVETFERRCCCIDLDDDLVGHLDEFWRCTDRGAWNDASVLGDGGRLHNGNIELVVWLLEGIETTKVSVGLKLLYSVRLHSKWQADATRDSALRCSSNPRLLNHTKRHSKVVLTHTSSQPGTSTNAYRRSGYCHY